MKPSFQVLPQAIAVFAIALIGCSNLRESPNCTSNRSLCEDGTAVARAGGVGGSQTGGQTGSDAQANGPDVPSPTSTGGPSDSGNVAVTAPPDADPGCPMGQHTCDGKCVDNKVPSSCGGSCDPCPTITGGTATCDGTRCGVNCPAGQKACPATGACIGLNDPCDGTCPAGKNLCNGTCVLPTDKTACGPNCTPCGNSANGRSECDGTQCTLTCNAGFHLCGSTCVDDKQVAHCGTSCTACPVPLGGSATCDGKTCGAACPAGNKLCLGACIGNDRACDGQCAAGKHNCSNNCVPNDDVNSCGTSSCTPCAVPGGGRAKCTNGACDFDCVAGNKCNGKCVTAENCTNGMDDDCDGQVDCADSQCGAGTTCGGGRSCRNGKCLVPCSEGTSCGDNPNKCTNGRISCSGDNPACVDGAAKCRADEDCNNGICSPKCAPKSCDTGNPCTTGTTTCPSMTCVGTPKPNGTSCPGAGDKSGSCQSGSCNRTCPTGTNDCGNNSCRACCNDGQCGGAQRCSSGTCVNLGCNECQVPSNHQCVAKCTGGSMCVSGACCGGVGEKCCKGDGVPPHGGDFCLLSAKAYCDRGGTCRRQKGRNEVCSGILSECEGADCRETLACDNGGGTCTEFGTNSTQCNGGNCFGSGQLRCP
jgi:hypothetical protein